jgi:uncharacterized protein
MHGEAMMDEMSPLTPPAVMGLYDAPMWESIRAHRMALQRCTGCGTVLYPPGPVCPSCLSDTLEWVPVSGRGRILSWAIFHRQYLAAYPAPYNAIAVALDEGAIMISNLEGPAPEGNWIGRAVRMVYTDMQDGAVLPRFTLTDTP